MTVRFVPLDAMGELPPGRLDAAVAALEAAAADILPLLDVDRVDVMVHASGRLIPGWDLNGYAINAGLITIGLSTKPRLLAERSGSELIDLSVRARPLSDQLRSVLAHELHHAVRSRGPGYGRSLGEALVSEGLAQCFEEEAGCPTPNYATVVTGDLLGLAAMRARKDWERADYDHGRWFFGDRTDPAWPWSGGYSLGYAIVREYLAQTGQTASAAAAVPAGRVCAQTDGFLAKLAATAMPDEEAA